MENANVSAASLLQNLTTNAKPIYANVSPEYPIIEVDDGNKRRPKKTNNSPIEVSINDLEAPVDKGTISRYNSQLDDLKLIIKQSDVLLGNVKSEIDELLGSRFKGKHSALPSYFDSASKILSVKASAINNMSNIIKLSTEMDYKLAKDIKENEIKNDEQYVMDMYRSMISIPMSQNSILSNSGISNPTPGSIPTGVNTISIMGDKSYSDISNSVRQTEKFKNTMYAINSKYQDVVVYDANTNKKYFSVLDTETGQLVPEAPAKDQIFMADTVLDLKNNIARNNNIGQSYPIIIINDPIQSGKL